MGRKSRTRQLAIWMNGELVGFWSVDAAGRHELGYSARWLESPSARPLSLSLPLRSPGIPYRGEIARARSSSYRRISTRRACAQLTLSC
jgi:serine/threonine-protein kinase HipA